MSGSEGPMVSRRRLGQVLASYRRAADMTLEDIAETLECSTWKIRKIEAGKVGVPKPELMLMLDRYGVTDEETRSQLGELARTSRQRGWWSSYNRHLSQGDSTLFGLESDAIRLSVWAPLVLPELLQTTDYARAVYAAQGYSEEETYRRAEILTSRQALAWDERDRAVNFIVDESALRRRVLDRPKLRAQLGRLLELPPGWTFGVIPLETEGHPGTMEGFTVMDFPDDQHDPVAYTRGLNGSAGLVEATERVAHLRRLIDRLAATALGHEASTALVRRILAEPSTTG